MFKTTRNNLQIHPLQSQIIYRQTIESVKKSLALAGQGDRIQGRNFLPSPI